MLSTKKILSVGVGIASMAGVMAMSTAPVVAAEGTIEVVTHAGAGGGTDVNSRMMMIRTRPVSYTHLTLPTIPLV